MCKQYKISIYSIATGIVITLITVFFPNVFLLGVSYWGYLLPWMVHVNYPGAPFEILWINFLVNVTIWSVLIYLALLSVEEEKKKPVKRKSKRKKKKKKKPKKRKKRRKR